MSRDRFEWEGEYRRVTERDHLGRALPVIDSWFWRLLHPKTPPAVKHCECDSTLGPHTHSWRIVCDLCGYFMFVESNVAQNRRLPAHSVGPEENALLGRPHGGRCEGSGRIVMPELFVNYYYGAIHETT